MNIDVVTLCVHPPESPVDMLIQDEKMQYTSVCNLDKLEYADKWQFLIIT